MSVGRKLETSAKWILGNFTLGKNCAADILATCTTMEHRWGKRKHEKPKNTRKILDTIQWTVPTYIINHKKIKIICGTPKRNEHRNQDKLWQTPPLTSLLGKKTAEKVFWSCCPFRNPWLSFLVRVCQQQFQQWFVAHCVALFQWKRSISETIQPPKRNFSIKWTNKNLMKDKYELSAGKPGSDLLPHCCTFEKIRQYILFLLLLQTHYQQIFHLSPKCFLILASQRRSE